MAQFFGIAPGEEKSAPGIRVRVSPDGERVWMHGKWLDLGPDHGVLWAEPGERVRLVRRDGTEAALGEFPAWVCRGSARQPALAAMFSTGTLGAVRLGRVVLPCRCPAALGVPAD